MSYNRHIIFSLLCIFQISLSTGSTNQNKDDESIRITPLYVPEVPEAVRDVINNELLKQRSEPSEEADLSEEEKEELELVFEYAPAEAGCIVSYLRRPSFSPGDEDYRFALFAGETGTGKTATARSIAQKMTTQSGWNYKFLPSTSLLEEHPKQTALRLRKELEAATSSGKPTIIIIDDLNILFEDTDSKYYDTPTKMLATFLDEQKNNKEIFLIGTMINTTKLPKFFKDKGMFNPVKFNMLTDPRIKKNILRRYLTTKYTNLDAEVTAAFLCKELEKIGSCSGRDLKTISDVICEIQSIDTTNKMPILMIKKASITKAIDEYLQSKEELQCYLEDEKE